MSEQISIIDFLISFFSGIFIFLILVLWFFLVAKVLSRIEDNSEVEK